MTMDGIYARTVERIVAGTAPTGADGFDAALWEGLREAGFDLLLAPEAAGGAGDAFAGAAEALRALGGLAGAVPLAERLAACWCLGAAGLDIAPGPTALVLTADTPVALEANVLRCMGPLPVPWGPVAEELVLLADHGAGPRLHRAPVPPGEDMAGPAGEPVRRLPPGTAFETATVAADDRALAVALTMKAAEMLGAAERVCSLSIEHAGLRRQFGRPLSKFQAIQHMAARMACEVAAMHAGTEAALAGLTRPDPLFPAAAGWVRCCEAAGAVAAAGHQIHGAIGYTRDHELHRLTRRLYSWRENFGKETFWSRHLGRLAIGGGAGWLWPALTGGSTACGKR